MDTSLKNSIRTSLIDQNITSDQNLQHSIIYNKNKKMISELKDSLRKCDEFKFSVAFITMSGVSAIKQELIECQHKNIKGKIITGNYLNFSDPKAIRELMKFDNIEVKFVMGDNLHTKGYFFKQGNYWHNLIGSSNLTQNALKSNHELNLKFTSHQDGQLSCDIINYFDTCFKNASNAIDIIDLYELSYNENKINNTYKPIPLNISEYTPNSMQEAALINIARSRNEGNTRGLLVSATGSGKTFLSAFDVQKFNPKRMLFVVHRETIAKKALDTFLLTMSTKQMGLYTGNKKDIDAEYLFATIQTISKEEHLLNFKKDDFDYIIIDEVHHSGAQSYLKLIEYFNPKYLLGMTATPERSDDFNIYQLFDYNIVHEVRLKDALEADLLAPFHYFGISDITVKGELIDETANLIDLTLDSRFEHIINQSNVYGYSGDTLHSLVFVSRVEEGEKLAKYMQDNGINAFFLSGQHSEAQRESVIKSFETGVINYIITVDIFNEGVDIPCINQILLVRPTKSAIVYVQQLGRGLRKSPNKEYVVVIDFIGNYKSNFLIAVALSQNTDGEKDKIGEFIKRPNEFVVGESIISFEKVIEDKIFNQIMNTNLTTFGTIRKEYIDLKNRLNRKPLLFDFIEHHKTSAAVILENVKSVIELYKKLNEVVDDSQELALTFFSQYFIKAKRVHEIEIIKALKIKAMTLEELNSLIEEKYNLSNQYATTTDALNYLLLSKNKSFSNFKKYSPLLKKENNLYELNFRFDLYFTDLFRCIDFFIQDESPMYISSFVKNGLYTRLQCAQIANMEYSNGVQVSGYFGDKQQMKMLVFINFDDKSSFTSYDNTLVNDHTVTWFSKRSRKLMRDNQITTEGQIANLDYQVHIFGRKNDHKSFYYLGEVISVLDAEETTIVNNEKEESIIKYLFKLDGPIKDSIYNYLYEGINI